MSIVEWPEEIGTEACVQCVVCAQTLQIKNTTMGLLERGTRKAFICAEHLSMGESMRFLRAYIDSGAARLGDLDEGRDETQKQNRVDSWRMSSLNSANL
jgi:hypothetical protein